MNTRKTVRRLSQLGITLLACAVAGLWACNQRPRVAIEGGTKPSFKLSGSGNIQVISVDGPDFENPNSREAGTRHMKPYWQIAPKGDYDIRRFEKSGGLVYGQVPEGFRQVFPEHEAAPQPLLENELFTFSLRVANGGSIGVRFVIYNNRAVVEDS